MSAIEVIRPSSREEWLALRREGIGSSEVGTVLGVNRYETPFQLWLDKTGQVPPKAETMPMLLGHLLEGAVAELFCRESGCSVEQGTEGDWISRSDIRPYTQGSPDRICVTPSGERVLLECKTTQMSVSPDDFPMPWYCQVQYLLLCTGLERGALAWLSRGRDFGFLWVEADAEFRDFMLSRLDSFWYGSVKGGTPPAPVSAADTASRFPLGAGGLAEADPETAEAVRELRVAKLRLADAEGRVGELEDKIKAFMGDRETLTVGGETAATWKNSKPRQTLDAAALRKEMPDVAARFTREGAPSRRFLLK